MADERESWSVTVDALIVSTALVHGMALVTRNVRDVAGLGADVVDPWSSS